MCFTRSNWFDEEEILNTKLSALGDIVDKMLQIRYKLRPTCAEVLSQFNSWDITINEVEK